MPGNNQVTLKVQLEEKVKDLQQKIINSSMPQEKQNKAFAAISQVTSILGKGANATAKDFNKASTLLSSVIKDLVNSAAGMKGIPKELETLQNQLKKLTEERAKMAEQLKSSRVKGPDQVPKKYLDDLAKEKNLIAQYGNTRGKQIRSYEYLKKEALLGNTEADIAAKEILTRTQSEGQEYLNLKAGIALADSEIEITNKDITKLGDTTDPSNSAAVKMQEFGNELDILIQKLKTINDEGNQISNNSNGNSTEELVNPNKELNDLNKGIEKQSGAVGKAIKQMTIYGLVIKNVRTAMRSAVKTVQDLDKNLTEQAMVTGKTREQTYALLKSYQEIAKTTGATTKEVAQVSTQFMRQGKTAQEALKLTEAAISAAKVAGISATESVNYLTTALNGFQMSASDAMKVSDKFAAIAATSATSYDELATALSKVASQANLAGMSIDYTTALLAKGLETTREAPETMGTALKTIIARMRELTDYGETLAGDTDINNVETQLAYVDIKLKDTNGELRSTQDVLDELGKKWDTLNSNQQAAVAKALAGTRQQSRLIAMMTDYERVIELQEVAQRSQGATLAQMATYMEGMEAALNKVKVAWEEIVSNAVNNDALIKLVEFGSKILEGIGEALKSQFVSITSLVFLSAALLGSATKRWEVQKAQNRAILEEKKTKIATELIDKKAYLMALKQVQKAKEFTRETAIANVMKKTGCSIELATAQVDKAMAVDKLALEKEIALTQSEITGLQLQQAETSISLMQNASGLTSIFGNLLSVLTPIMTIMQVINMLQLAQNKNAIAGIGIEKKGLLARIKTLGVLLGQAYTKCITDLGPIAGNIVAAGVVASVAGMIALAGVSIHKGISGTKKSESEKTSESIDKLSSKIYNLNKQATELDNIVDSFDKIDNKVLKTNADLKEMEELLTSAADSLTDAQKEEYEGLITTRGRRDYLEQIAKQAEAEARTLRNKQIDEYNSLKTEAQRLALLKENSDWVYAINNSRLYTYVDEIENIAEGVETLTQNILEELDASVAAALLNNPEVIKSLVTSLNELQTSYALTNDDASLMDKINAYTKTYQFLTGDMKEAFHTLYNEFDRLVELQSINNGQIIEYIDSIGITTDKLNELYSSYEKLNTLTDLNFVSEDYRGLIDNLLANFASGQTSIKESIESVFGTYIDEIKASGGEYQKAWDQIVNIIDNSISTTILNIGQNLDSLTNMVDNIYETTSKWNTMSQNDKFQFMQDNAELFAGDPELAKAFESGNYNSIHKALMNNATLLEKIEERRQELFLKIQIEKARSIDQQNQSLIYQLELELESLNNLDEFTEVSLEQQVEQEEAQLNIYKEYLQKQKEALEKNLNSRKEAYQKYFDAVNQEAEDEDYEENVEKLMTSLNKLATSTDTSSQATKQQLEKQLKDLEEERIKTLRERAQEAVITDIDDTINDINDKFDELLENSYALLNAMNIEMSDPTNFLASLFRSGAANLTDLQTQNLLETYKTTFFSSDLMSGIDWNNISTSADNRQVSLSLNQENITTLTRDQENVVIDTIFNLLKEMGVS